MKGLLLKDCYLTLRYQKALLLIMAAFSFGGAAAAEHVSPFLTFYPCLMAGMMIPSLLAYDEREKWHIYAQTMPVTRAQYVTGKYLFGLCIAAVMSGLRAIAMLLGHAGLSWLTLRFAVCLLLQALMLPFLFWRGAEKGRLIYAIAVGLAVGAAMGWTGPGLGGGSFKTEGAPLAAAALALYTLSWRVSVRLYRRREL